MHIRCIRVLRPENERKAGVVVVRKRERKAWVDLFYTGDYATGDVHSTWQILSRANHVRESQTSLSLSLESCIKRIIGYPKVK